MAITKDEVVEYLKGITLLEASELVKELEEVFGVSAAAATAVARRCACEFKTNSSLEISTSFDGRLAIA